VLEERRQIDPNNAAEGTVAFHQQFRSPAEALTLSTRDRDVALYVQDSWKPKPRLTANLGVRVDFVRRHDEIFNIDRENATQVGPRAGVSFLVTSDAKNVLRASYGRLYEQTNGRDYITTFAQGLPRGSTQSDKYDANGDGVYETIVVTPAATAALSGAARSGGTDEPGDARAGACRRAWPGARRVDRRR
jgi:outer membrane receptor protein involved in Fe transport